MWNAAGLQDSAFRSVLSHLAKRRRLRHGAEPRKRSGCREKEGIKIKITIMSKRRTGHLVTERKVFFEVGDLGLRTGDAAVDGGKFALVESASGLDIGSKLVETGTELEGGAEKKFRAHGFEVLFVEGAFDAGQTF